MDSFLQKIITIPSNYIVIALIACCYTLEHLQNSSVNFKDRFDHLFNNLFFYITVVLFSYLFAWLQVFTLQWINNHHLGLFNQVHFPFVAKVIIGIACFDLTLYWFHRLSHTYPVLWSLHRVHHSDTKMDASTFFRHHPLEVLINVISSLVAGIIFGLDATILAIYVFIVIPWMIVQHSAIQFPPWFDKIAGKIFVTPSFHKLHHSQDRQYTDSNFADIFIFWDKLFGTFQPNHPGKMEYGLKEFKEENKQSFWYLMKSPFVKSTAK